MGLCEVKQWNQYTYRDSHSKEVAHTENNILIGATEPTENALYIQDIQLLHMLISLWFQDFACMCKTKQNHLFFIKKN